MGYEPVKVVRRPGVREPGFKRPLVAVEQSGDERADVQGPSPGRAARTGYLSVNVFRTGALVRPDVSRAAIVTV